ncbi:hypothetical protein [Leptospira johnsonii]|uniref:hypothetical protein n=1 Tax=Leptospira johnsonii TaxID=1917820 RepID=UPI001FE3E9C9|nr:hypothetical protein [Leptospira johnsonii]
MKKINPTLSSRLFILIFTIISVSIVGPTFADANDYTWTSIQIPTDANKDYPAGYNQGSNNSSSNATDSATCKELCAQSSNCNAFWFSNGTRHARTDSGTIIDRPYPLCLHYSSLPSKISWNDFDDVVDYTERIFEKKGPLKACMNPNSFKVGGSYYTSSLEKGKAYTGIGYLLGYLNSPQDCANEILSNGGNAWVWIYIKGLNTLITGYCFGSSTGQDSGTQFTLKNSPARVVFPTTEGECTANENECTQTSQDSYPSKKCCARGKFYQCSNP